MTVLVFGPLAYDVSGAEVPADWRAFVREASGPARAVEVHEGAVPDDDPIVKVRAGSEIEVAGLRFVARRGATSDRVRVDRSLTGLIGTAPPGSVGLVAAMAALTLLDAPAAGALVVHAAGVRAAGGVVLLPGAPGVGKSTRARAAGPRAWAYNAALVIPGPTTRAFPLPFAGEPDPALERVEGANVLAVALLERAAGAFVERLEGARATVGVLGAVVRPEGDDPQAPARARLSLEFAARVPVVRLGSPPDASYLAPIDRLLEIQRESK